MADDVLIALKDRAEAAQLEAACDLVAPGAGARVVHIAETPGSTGERMARALVDEAVASLRERGHDASGLVVPRRGRSVPAALGGLLRTLQPRIVVMGSGGTGSSAGLLGHGVSRSLLPEMGHADLLLVPHHAPVSEHALQRVLVVITREEEADQLRDVVLRLPANPEIVLVHAARRVAVHPVGAGSPYAEVPETSPELMEPLGRALLHAHRGPVTAHLLEDGGRSARTVGRAAAVWNADLIVLSARRPGRIMSLTAGSPAHDLVRHVEQPVLLSLGS